MSNRAEQCVALVTGGSQGVGRGIAVALGSAGHTVYISGRSQERLNAAAGEVTRRGGRGIGIVCDHTIDAQVESLFSRIRDEHGRLNLLVNNVWGGYEGHPHGIQMKPFWEVEDDWDAMFNRGLRAHFIASRLGAPLLLGQSPALIVNTVAWAGGKFLLNLYYDVVKHAVVRMTYGMALELRSFGVAAVAVAPGFTRTERVMQAHAAHAFDLSGTESPEYCGRAIAHLLADTDVMSRSGRVLTTGSLAREYGFTDIDGSQPAEFVLPAALSRD